MRPVAWAYRCHAKNLAKPQSFAYLPWQYTRHAYGCLSSYAQIERVFYARSLFSVRPFRKPAIDIPEQLALLKKRGLSLQDEDQAHAFLETVSFFRLTPYMRPFQLPDDAEHGFKPGTSLQALMRLGCDK